MTTKSTRIGQLFDSVRAGVAELQERLCLREVVIGSIFGDSCAMPGPSLRSLVENFRAVLNK